MYLYLCGSEDDSGVTWLPEDLIEGWTSLIWTERYTEAGEFQLKTPVVEDTLTMLPDGSLIGINDSKELMRVENHSIAVNDAGVAELTVTGRSFETYLENRMFRGDYKVPYEMLQSYTVQDAIAVCIFEKLVNTDSLNDVTGGNSGAAFSGLEYILAAVTTANIVPSKPASTDAPNDLSDLQSTTLWYLQDGEVYPTVLDWLKLGDLGIRCSRPMNSYSTVVSVNSAGVISHPAITGHEHKLMFEIYNGRNRSMTPSSVDPHTPVIFRYDAGHLSSPSYLISRKNYRNFCRVLSSDGEENVWDNDDKYGWTSPSGVPTVPIPAPIGILRHGMTLDAGDVDPAAVDSTKWMRQKGKTALKNANRQLLLDSAISANAPYSYGSDYNLGDLVTVMGEYDVMDTMRVNEYVRTQDKDGERAFPTLIRPDPEF